MMSMREADGDQQRPARVADRSFRQGQEGARLTDGSTPEDIQGPGGSERVHIADSSMSGDRSVADLSNSDGASATHSAVTNRNSVAVESESISADGDVYIGHKIEKTELRIREATLEGIGVRRRPRFSSAHLIANAPPTLQRARELLIYSEERFAAFRDSLERNRLLVLAGPNDVGKYYIATNLAASIVDDDIGPTAVATVASLASDVQVDIVEEVKIFERKVVVFRDAFDRGNRDLDEFMCSLRYDGHEAIKSQLKKNDSYLLFTSDFSELTDYEAVLAEKDILGIVVPPDEAALREELKRRLFSHGEKAGYDAEETLTFLTEKEPCLASRLGTFRNIYEFVDSYLRDVLAGDTTLNDAIDRTTDIEKSVRAWYVRDLKSHINTSEGFQCWCFAICLSMTGEMNWWRFFELYRAVCRCIYAVVNPELKENGLKGVVSETILLSRSRAAIHKDAGTGSDMVAFDDGRVSAILFGILLKEHRVLLPAITRCLERISVEREQEGRSVAARCLGKLGECDPLNITSRYILDWSNAEQYYQRATLGYLFEGIMESSSSQYVEQCFREVKRLAGGNHRQQWAAVAILKQIGINNIELAMEELRMIVVANLQKRPADFWMILEEGDGGLGSALEKLETIYKRSEILLSTVRYSIVALCYMVDPVSVLDGLRKWMLENDETGDFVSVLFFLGSDGIAENLGPGQVDDENAGSDADKIGGVCIVQAINGSTDRLHVVTNFIRELYRAIDVYPKWLHRHLADRLLGYIRQWAVNALSNRTCKDDITRLLTSLCRTGRPDLRDGIMEELEVWSEEGGSLAEFAEYVRRAVDGMSTKRPLIADIEAESYGIRE